MNARSWFYSRSFHSSCMAENAEPQKNISVEAIRAKADNHAEDRAEVVKPQPASKPDGSTGDSARVICPECWGGFHAICQRQGCYCACQLPSEEYMRERECMHGYVRSMCEQCAQEEQ